MEKTLRLFTYVDGGINDTPFPNAEAQIEIGAFRYDAKRMGGAPTITATIMHHTCLDKVWADMVYVSLNGERYFLKQTPTSSKSNDDARYKHDVEFIAERVILDNTYFYDAVIGVPLENDVPVTNSTKFHFYGHIETFVRRMNASLQYTGIQKVDEDGNVISGYRVVLDDDVVTRDQKQVSFDGAVFSQALQEAYNTFGIPFYFDGKTIHVGFSNNIIDDVLEYGVDGALISATKTNANFKVVNRATGEGSTDNIPYFYPNNSPKGEIEAVSSNPDLEVTIEDYEKFSNEVKIDDEIIAQISQVNRGEATLNGNRINWGLAPTASITVTNENIITDDLSFNCIVDSRGDCVINLSVLMYRGATSHNSTMAEEIDTRIVLYGKTIEPTRIDGGYAHYTFKETFENEGTFSLNVLVSFKFKKNGFASIRRSYNVQIENKASWIYNSKYQELSNLGLSTSSSPSVGDTITQRLVKKVNTSSTLQPSIYRATDGKERFYNAINYPFPHEEGYELKYGEYVLDGEVHNDAYKKDDGTYYEFTNEYKEGRPREHVFTVDDIKPTIKEMTNDISWIETDEEGNEKTVFQRIDMFSEFAYDEDDNDETYIAEDGSTNLKHPYFFAKLRRLPFNLFEHASENGAMTFSMTSGNCGACNFEIGVSKDEPQYNTVQVYEQDFTDANGVFHPKGSLVRDEEGRVLCGLEDYQPSVPMQPIQQDTINNEVWIALKKEENTYGILMPKAPVNGIGGHRPVACSSENTNDGDTFVILNITLPDEYIYKAEKKLEKAIVKYIWENNVEKFNFSVNFSRIFLEENQHVINTLNENARLTRVKYNGDEYILYVSSYSYSMNEGDVLPEIRIELDDTLTISQNALQNAIDSVKSDIASAINAIDVAAIGSRYFLRKDMFDTAEAPIEFKKGLVFGDNGVVDVNEDGTSKMTIDYLEVTRKATFTSLEIQEQSHVGGEILITPASMVCNNVEELEDAYRCYFETYGENGEEIFNQFVEGDQAISQTFNEWGGHYYWRLVVGVGENYIDLSKSDCAPESDVPAIGNKIIQLGNRGDISRQAAQVLSSHGENAPSFIMYNGIDSFSLEGKDVTGIIWNPKTQEPQMYSHGSFFFGDGTTDANGNLVGDSYITYQKKDGEDKKQLYINANVTLGSDSTGLSNLEEWKDADKRIGKVEESTKNIEDILKDGVLTASEKQALKNELAMIEGDHAEITNDYNTYLDEFEDLILDGLNNFVTSDDSTFEVSRSTTRWNAYETAYNAYKKDLEDNIASEDGTPVGNLSKSQVNYYNAKIALLDEITKKKNTEEDYVQDSALLARKEITDFEYLKDAFGNAKSMNVEGVIMSQMTSVRNEDNEIEAFLNGSTFAKDDSERNCGKLIFAAGIPEGDASELENRSRQANTRIYEDGCIYSNNLHLQDGCTVGDLNIRYGSIEAGEYKDDDYTQAVILSKGGISTQGKTAITGRDERVDIGDFCGYYSMDIDIGGSQVCYVYDKEVGLHINTPDAYSILSRAGMFAGLRPKTRVIKVTGYPTNPHKLTDLDHTIIVNVESGMTYLNVPLEPQEGQRYEIYTCHANMDLCIYFNGVNVYSFPEARNYNGADAVFEANQRRYIELIYAEGQWWMNYRYLVA